MRLKRVLVAALGSIAALCLVGNAWAGRTAPDTTITSAPTTTVTTTSASFEFTSSDRKATFQCRLDSGSWFNCSSPYTWNNIADGAHTFSARAVDHGVVDPTPPSVTFTAQKKVPDTTITSAPSGTVTTTSATFSFTADAPATFQCRLDSGSWFSCSSPYTWSNVADGQHTFSVRATNGAGTDATPASVTFTAQKKLPDTTITSGPSGAVSSTTATFTFTSDEASATFQCNLDSLGWTACTSPKTYSSLAQRQHTFQVRAVDTVGVDPTPATATWTVDLTPPPVPSITSAPAGTTGPSNASVSFTDAEAGVTFVCSLDGAPAQSCTSPAVYSSLGSGTHTFTVAAQDAAGNRSATASASWRIDASAPPMPGIATAPANPTSSTDATIGFTEGEPGATLLCSFDGSAPSPCTSPFSVSGLAAGTHRFSVAAQDQYGNTSAATTWSWAIQSEQLSNGSFEGSLDGWAVYDGSLAAASDGTVGSSAAQVTAATSDVLLYTSPRPVQSAVAGWAYSASAWVRSDTAGRTLCIRLRELAGATSTQVQNQQSCLVLTTTWQRFAPLTLVPQTAGDQVTLQFYESGGAAGDTFEVDGVTLIGGPPPPTNQYALTNGDPVIAAAGDIACAPNDPDYNGGQGQNSRCAQASTAALLSHIPGLSAVLPLGDEQYECAELSNFLAVYDATWGVWNAIAHPVPGNHEYGNTTSCPQKSDGGGYYSYFGSSAGDPTKGYYSYDIGSWHVIALNSECWAVGGCGAGSPQETWLRQDLAAHPALCTLAYWHDPAFSVGQTGIDSTFTAFWQDLYDAHAEIVLSGHDHTYQRWARVNPSGAVDPNGVRQMVIGTGGEELFSTLGSNPSLTVANNNTFGVLKLTLRPTGYDAQFIPAPGGGGFTDSFSTSCIK